MTKKLKINLLLFLIIVVSGVFLLPRTTQADTSGKTTIVGYCYTTAWGSPIRPAFRVYWLDMGGTLGNYALRRRVSADGGKTYGNWEVFMSGPQFQLSRSGGIIEIGKDVQTKAGYYYQYRVWTWRLGKWELSNTTTVPATPEHCMRPAAPEITISCTGTGADRQVIVDWTIARNAKYNIMRRGIGASWEQPDKVWELGPLPHTNIIGPGPGFQVTRWMDKNPPTTGKLTYQVKSDVGVASFVTGTLDNICTGNQLPLGWLDYADCNQFAGWAYDPDIKNQPIQVHFWEHWNGPNGLESLFLGSVETKVMRGVVNSIYGLTGTHGFSFPTPTKLKDGKPHDIYAYGIDNEGKGNPPLSGNPRQMLACAPPNKPPAGEHNTATCTNTTGWAKDPDTSSPIRVHIFKDGKIGQGGAKVADVLANKPTASVAGNYGFSWTIPASLKDGKPHDIYAYAVDSVSGTRRMIEDTPKPINCGTWDVSLAATPNSGTAPLTSTLRANGTGTATGNILWQFDCTNNGSFEHEKTNTSDPYSYNCSYPTARIYTARVRSTKQGITVTDTTTITVVSPTWNISVSANPSSGTVPLSSVITAKKVSGSTATGSTAWTFNCGDGNGDITKPTAAGVEQSTYTCTYNSQGAYTATVSAVRAGITDTDSVNINVTAPEKPTVDLDILTEPDYCTSPLGITANWIYGHSTDPQKYYRIQIDDNSDFSSPLFDTGMLESNTDSKYIVSGDNPLYTNSGDMLYGSTLYYVRVRVRIIDRWPDGVASDWSNVLTWTTPNERFPQPEFSWEPEQVIEDEEVQFTDESVPQSSVRTLNWLFGDGNSSTDKDPTHTYELDGNKSVTLTVNGACLITKDLTVKEKPPIWKEILPNLFFFAPLPGLEPGSSGPKPDILSIILQGLFRK